MLSYLWGGKKNTEKPENADSELAMREQLDEHGDFNTKVDGTLEYEDFLFIRAVILRQALRMFQEPRKTITAKRQEAFDQKNQQLYV